MPLPYLRDPNYSSYDVRLEVAIPPAGGDRATVVTTSNYRHMYWTAPQQLVHHSVTGCDMRPADLLASGGGSWRRVVGLCHRLRHAARWIFFFSHRECLLLTALLLPLGGWSPTSSSGCADSA